jgi:hypothetical protein
MKCFFRKAGSVAISKKRNTVPALLNNNNAVEFAKSRTIKPFLVAAI